MHECPATTTPTMSSRRITPQSPAHPGRKQDDTRGRSPGFRVSACRSPSQGTRLSGILNGGSPVTVAGAAAVSHRVPFNPLREPRAKLNARGAASSTSTCRRMHAISFRPRSAPVHLAVAANEISPRCLLRERLRRCGEVEQFAAYNRELPPQDACAQRLRAAIRKCCTQLRQVSPATRALRRNTRANVNGTNLPIRRAPLGSDRKAAFTNGKAGPDGQR